MYLVGKYNFKFNKNYSKTRSINVVLCFLSLTLSMYLLARLEERIYSQDQKK